MSDKSDNEYSDHDDESPEPKQQYNFQLPLDEDSNDENLQLNEDNGDDMDDSQEQQIYQQ